MKRFTVLLILLLVLAVPTALYAQAPPGFSVTCDSGAHFDNGVEIVINQMRSGFTYKATAIGLNGFDPVLAVLYTGETEALCSDDERSATNYAVSLPTTGRVSASTLSAQISFSQNSRNTFEDVSLVVGGFGNQTGEFVLILEGMAVTSGDGAGDIFTVYLTPGMVASGVPLTTYMITRGSSAVDPLFYVAGDADLNAMTDADGYEIYCDDANDSTLCYTPMDISSSTITIDTGTLWTWDKDAVLSLNITGLTLSDDPNENYLDYVMTSYRRETEGQYLLAFHIGISDAVPQTQLGGGERGGGQLGGEQSGGSGGTGSTGGGEQRGGSGG